MVEMGQVLEYFLIASGITDPKQKTAVLLHIAGPEIQDVFDPLPGSGGDYSTAQTRLISYFEPKKDMAFERHIFRSTAQQLSDALDAFATRLRQFVKSCDYGEMAKAK